MIESIFEHSFSVSVFQKSQQEKIREIAACSFTLPIFLPVKIEKPCKKKKMPNQLLICKSILKNIAENLLYIQMGCKPENCAYNSIGCHVESYKKDVLRCHQNVCIYRWVSHILSRLSSMKVPKITASELEVFDRLNKENVCQLHYVPEFQTKFRLFDNATFKRPKRFSLLVSKIEVYGKVFVERMEMDAFGLFHHWIHFVGSATEAQQFYYIIEYKGNYSRNVFHGLFHGQVVPATQNLKSIFYNFLGLCMNSNVLETQFLESGWINYSIQIKHHCQ